jgi:hypothetical protein
MLRVWLQSVLLACLVPGCNSCYLLARRLVKKPVTCLLDIWLHSLLVACLTSG